MATNTTSPTNVQDAELHAMAVAVDALSSLDEAAKKRVLGYLSSRFSISMTGARQEQALMKAQERQDINNDDREIPGVCALDDEGNLRLTVRDLKARSTQDAALRIAHIVIYCSEKLTGVRSVSSRKVLVPILKEYRAYDSNARTALARHKGILRNGDSLSLDAHSRKEAEQYVADILDEGVEGKWNPRSVARKRTGPARKKEVSSE